MAGKEEVHVHVGCSVSESSGKVASDDVPAQLLRRCLCDLRLDAGRGLILGGPWKAIRFVGVMVMVAFGVIDSNVMFATSPSSNVIVANGHCSIVAGGHLARMRSRPTDAIDYTYVYRYVRTIRTIRSTSTTAG